MTVQQQQQKPQMAAVFVRMPPALRRKVEAGTRKSHRSLSGEICAILEEYYAAARLAARKTR